MKFDFRKLFFFILFISLLKIFYVIFFVDHFFLWEVNTIAHNFITTGEMFTTFLGVKNYSCEFPVYPFFISALYYLFGENPIYPVFYNRPLA